MAEWNELQTLTFEAAADLSACQYHAVRISAANRINLASDPGASSLIGILTTKPKATEFGTVAWLGKGKVVAGAAINVGAFIGPNSSGRAVAVASGVGTMTIGRALDAAIADGDVISALILCAGRWSGAV
jgi:hypothetical protein